MSLWAFAVVSRMPDGPRIGFLVFFGVFVFAVVVTIFVTIYRFWNRRKKKADERLVAIAREAVRETLRDLADYMKAEWPELEAEIAKAVDETWKNLKVAYEPFLEVLEAFATAILDHTHNDNGQAEFPRLKEVTDLLESMPSKKDSQSDED